MHLGRVLDVVVAEPVVPVCATTPVAPDEANQLTSLEREPVVPAEVPAVRTSPVGTDVPAV